MARQQDARNRRLVESAVGQLCAYGGGAQPILAVGSVTDAGEITLNCVSPDSRFRGISPALLVALEMRAMERGHSQCTLTSTGTARALCLARGYTITGPPVRKFGSGGYPMSTLLAAN
jgi:GNAT superfamily N-acetyltransferase